MQYTRPSPAAADASFPASSSYERPGLNSDVIFPPSVTATLPALAASAVGETDILGTGAVSLPPFAADGSGIVEVTGSADASLFALIADVSGIVEVTGSGVASLSAFTADVSGYLKPKGAAAASLPFPVFAAQNPLPLVPPTSGLEVYRPPVGGDAYRIPSPYTSITDSDEIPPYTISVWLYVNALPQNAGFLTQGDEGEGFADKAISIYLRTTTGQGFAVNHQGDNYRVGTPPIGEWFHLAVTFGNHDPSTGDMLSTLYVNGVELHSELITTDPHTFPSGTYFHPYFSYSDDFVDGEMARLRFYDRPLTAEEIETDRRSVFLPAIPGLLADYSFEEPKLSRTYTPALGGVATLYTYPEYVADADAALPGLTASVAGSALPPPVNAVATLPELTASASGFATDPTYSIDGLATLPELAASASGSVDLMGSGAATLPSPVFAAQSLPPLSPPERGLVPDRPYVGSQVFRIPSPYTSVTESDEIPPYTISAWIYLNSAPNTSGLLTQGNEDALWSEKAINFYIRDTAGEGFAINHGGDYYRAGTPPAGEWFHLAVTFGNHDPSTGYMLSTLYLDGVEIHSELLSTNPDNALSGAYFHPFHNSSDYWNMLDGQIARIRFYDRPLTTEEVDLDRRSALLPVIPGILADYSFEEPNLSREYIPALGPAATLYTYPEYAAVADAALPGLAASASGSFVSSTISGTVSAALPELTASLSGAVDLMGSGAAALPTLAAVGAGVFRVTGAAAATLPGAAADVAGTFSIAGEAYATLSVLSADSAGTYTPPITTGVGAAAAPALNAAASGAISVAVNTAVAAAALPTLGAAAAGSATVTGAASVSLEPMAGSATGAAFELFTGSSAIVLPALAASGSGSNALSGDAAASIPGLAANAAGGVVFSGQGLGSFPYLSASATDEEIVSGASAGTLPPLTASASGTVPLVGSAAAALPAALGWVSGASYNTAAPQELYSPVTYTCVLTGSADGLTDLVLPISTLQIRHRDDGSSYGKITVPAGLQYANGVAARLNGEVVVTWNQGSLSEECLRFGSPSVWADRGSSSSTLTLSGQYQSSARASKLFDLISVSYISSSGDGSKRYRTTGRGELRPGDQIRYQGVVDDVAQVVWSVSVGSTSMEITT